MDSIYRDTLARLEQRLQQPGTDDDDATVHVAVAQIYEELGQLTDAASWYRRASAHCAGRGNSRREVEYAKAAERIETSPRSRRRDATPRIRRPKGRR